MVEKRVLPEFKSEADEANWWFDHQDEILDDFIAAEAEGRLAHGNSALVYSVPVSNVIHLEPRSVAVAKKQAAKRGVDYEDYVQHLVDEGLMREAKAS